MVPQKYFLKALDPIHDQGLRVALGAFHNSSVQSLYVEAGESSVKHRRLKLSMIYHLIFRSLSEDPCYDLVGSLPLSELFEKSKTVPPFGTRILPHIVEADINQTSIHIHGERTPPPWDRNNNVIMFDTSLPCFKKDQTKENVFGKNTNSYVTDTAHTLKPTQIVQSVSRKWQLLLFTLKTLMTPEIFDYETVPLF